MSAMDARARIPVGPPVNNPLASYWHEPKSPLANVIEPETDDPSRPYDYAIIGSGISGAMIAHNLIESSPKARIVMLEAREVCSGATGRNGGHTKAASYRGYLEHVRELGKEEALKIARLEFANIIATHVTAGEMEIDCENQLCNTVDVIYDQPTFDLGKKAIEALREDARPEETENKEMAWYRIHEKGEAFKHSLHVVACNENPAVQEKEEVAGAIEYLAGCIHGYRFVTGILKECVKRGLQLCTNTPVHSILPSSTKTHNTDDSLWDIFTQYNTITTRNVILATNAYTAHVLKPMQGAIVPLRGQITAQRPGRRHKLTTPLATTYSFAYRDGYEYMIPRPLKDGTQHLIIGGGLGRLPCAGATEYGTVDDSRLNPDVSKYLHGSLVGYFGAENWGETDKGDTDGRVVQEWTGIMGATADGRPFVGEVPGQKGMWISAGFNGHGMVLCLKSAEALVAMMMEGVWKEWFPQSFVISGERLEQCAFKGRMDMPQRPS